jgi:glycosyltransferase involved in cell wall biosynthesis
VTIISPVLNCIESIPAHAEHLRSLSGVADEVIIVDSHSRDGTKQYLQEALGDLNIRFIDHPPGLYQSWNSAISSATQPYVTVATVGDVLPATSLIRLHETITRLSGDAVISAPTFVDMKGETVTKRWPIHELITRVGFEDPFILDAASWTVLNFGFYSATLIASSAGNLYRTSLLKEHPFPHDLGHWGDCAWAFQTSLITRWIIDPEVRSTFQLHPQSEGRKVTTNDEFDARRAALAVECLKRAEPILQESGTPSYLLEVLREAPAQIQRKHKIRSLYQKRRARWLPWFLNPRAIDLRKSRNEVEELMRSRRKLALDFIVDRLKKTPPMS